MVGGCRRPKGVTSTAGGILRERGGETHKSGVFPRQAASRGSPRIDRPWGPVYMDGTA
jgi:hypothetical protein